jgi:hypothetical protein
MCTCFFDVQLIYELVPDTITSLKQITCLVLFNNTKLTAGTFYIPFFFKNLFNIDGFTCQKKTADESSAVFSLRKGTD